MNDATIPTASQPNLSTRSGLTTIDGRYTLIDALGQGAGGQVHRARDRLSGVDVALKLVPRAAGGLGEEFLLARTLSHPYVARVLDVGRASAQFDYFTMELIDGCELTKVPGRWGWEGLARVAMCGALALDHVHGRGMSHADIKPANVLAIEGASGAEARLIDFGLARVAANGTLCGTPAYMAPEICRGVAPGPSTDLYALGVCLYEAISGTNPFAAPTVTETWERHRDYMCPTLGDIPPLFADVIARLLHKRPESRYASARALVHALIDVLPGGVNDLFADNRPMRPGQGAFVGRQAELDLLLSCLPPDRYLDAVLVRGASGSGKTRLLSELAARARLKGIRVVSVDCRRNRHGTGPVRELARVLTLRDRRGPTHPTSAEPARTVPTDTTVDAPAFEAPEEPLPQGFLPVLARRLTGRTTLLLLDDLDRCQTPGIRAIQQVIAEIVGRSTALVVAGVSDPQLTNIDLLGEEPATREVLLSPLDRAPFDALLRGTLGDVDSDGRLGRLLHTASSGCPGWLERILGALVDRRTVVWREGRWAVDPRLLLEDAEALACMGRQTDEQLLERLGLLSDPDARRLLDYAAVMGDSFRVECLAVLARGRGAEPDPAAFDACVTLLGRMGVFKHVDVFDEPDAGGGGMVSFADPSMRDTLHDALSPGWRARMHRRAAGVVCRHAPRDLETIARHFAHGDRQATALEAMEAAAWAAADAGQPWIAARLFRWMLRHGGEPSYLHEAVGDQEQVAGDFATALTHYDEAVVASRPTTRLLRKRGWAMSALGHCVDAQPTLELAFEGAEGSARHRCQYALAWNAMLQGDHGRAESHGQAALDALRAAPESGTGDRPNREQRLEWVGALEARLHCLFGTIAWHRGDPVRALEAFERGLAVAELAADWSVIADCRMGRGTALRLEGRFEEATAEYEEAARHNRAAGRMAQLAKCQNNLGAVHYLAGNWDRAAAAWAQFRDACARTGERPDLVMAHNNLGMLNRDRGELERAARELLRGREVAESAGFTRGLALVRGNFGEVCTLQGRYDEAREHLVAATQLALEIDSRNEWLKCQRRLAALAAASGEAQQALDEIDPVLAVAREQGNRAEQGHLLKIRGEALLDLDRAEDAIVSLGRAWELLKKSGGRLDAARARLALHRAVARLEDDEARDAIEQASEIGVQAGATDVIDAAEELLTERRANAAQGNGMRWLLGMAQRLNAGMGYATRASGSADESRPESPIHPLLEYVAELAIDLAGAQRGLVILYEPGERVRVGAARWAEPDLQSNRSFRISRTIADRVHRQGKPVIVTDAAAESSLQNQASILAMELRAIMCVPLLARSGPVGIVYVDSQEPKRVFDLEDVAVLEGFAELAAETIANALNLENEVQRAGALRALAQDMRTPLGALGIGLDLMLRDSQSLGLDLRRLVRSAREQVRRLDRMSEETLDLENLNRGRTPMRPTVLSPCDLLTASAAYLEPMARRRRVGLSVACEAELPDVEVDADRVQQVLDRLVGNAVRSLPRGGSITLRARATDRPVDDESCAAELGWSPRQSHPRRWVRVAVADDGPGVDAARLQALVNSRSWPDSGQPRASVGPDLGLAVARELIRSQGGDIWMESEPGSGTTVYFTMPVPEEGSRPTVGITPAPSTGG